PLLKSLPNVHSRVYYSRPDSNDREGSDYDHAGRLTASQLAQLEPPRDAEAYLCGPLPFMDEISAGLAALGIDASHIHTEPAGAGGAPRRRERAHLLLTAARRGRARSVADARRSRRAQCPATRPPSTCTVSPVTNVAFSR